MENNAKERITMTLSVDLLINLEQRAEDFGYTRNELLYKLLTKLGQMSARQTKRFIDRRY